MSFFENFKLSIIGSCICSFLYSLQFKKFKNVSRARFGCALSF